MARSTKERKTAWSKAASSHRTSSGAGGRPRSDSSSMAQVIRRATRPLPSTPGCAMAQGNRNRPCSPLHIAGIGAVVRRLRRYRAFAPALPRSAVIKRSNPRSGGHLLTSGRLSDRKAERMALAHCRQTGCPHRAKVLLSARQPLPSIGRPRMGELQGPSLSACSLPQNRSDSPDHIAPCRLARLKQSKIVSEIPPWTSSNVTRLRHFCIFLLQI